MIVSPFPLCFLFVLILFSLSTAFCKQAKRDISKMYQLLRVPPDASLRGDRQADNGFYPGGVNAPGFG
ncbi:hypothetical protein J2858_000123 [Neorhizobium galegae]|uniref:hypothetical protein n=1 Tax=Neorhizobium galegae TaxID=399 RepID=UPI001AEA0546|nr:hypothetical protein [Neorhizobium galegae]MBP2547230.1 hypothetical protein [Neorhizobium galegae]